MTTFFYFTSPKLRRRDDVWAFGHSSRIIFFKMSSYLVHAKELKDCFDFLSEPLSFIVLLDSVNQEISLVIKMGPNKLFTRQIVRESPLNQYRLELNLTCFDSKDELLDFYHENYLYDWAGSTVTRLKLKRGVYNRMLPLEYLARVVLKRNRMPIPYQHLEDGSSSKYF